MRIHAITGVPRSGSTLLCNILNQNPAFYASDTSPLVELLSTFSHKVSTNPEVQSALNNDDAVSERLSEMCRAMVREWYGHKQDLIVFDKSRGWSFQSNLLKSLFPDAKIINTVRDLRSVFASIEKQHQKQPIFDTANNVEEKTITGRAGHMLSNQGMIGQSAVGLQDLVTRNPELHFTVKYESFTRYPQEVLRELYEFIGEPYYEHDLDNIENVAADLDVLWLNKFPHEGSGKIVETKRNEWKEYLAPELANEILRSHPKYNEIFGYG